MKDQALSSKSSHPLEQTISSIGKSLLTDVVDAIDPSPERATDILLTLQNESCKQKPTAAAASNNNGSNDTNDNTCIVTIAILENTRIGKTLTKTVKACKRHKRTASQEETPQWEKALELAASLLTIYKSAADAEAKQTAIKKKKSEAAAEEASSAESSEGLPSNTSAYKARLITQKKELYKDPPALPPSHILIEETWVKSPKRDNRTGELTFPPGQNEETNKLLKEFRPNRTPEEILRSGSFGGTYFRPIVSAVTNRRYVPSEVLKDTVLTEWIEGLDVKRMLTSSTYRAEVNKFGVKCGGSLGMWESSGWIGDSDPYGWFQWYCRFYRGRRSTDDPRQLSRWLKSAGPKGRFRSQLCNKIIAANTHAGNAKISPVIRQTLLHWGLEVTESILERHRKRM